MFRVVVKFEVVLIFDIIVIKIFDIFVRIIYVGNVVCIVKCDEKVKVFFVCGIFFEVVVISGGIVSLEKVLSILLVEILEWFD